MSASAQQARELFKTLDRPIGELPRRSEVETVLVSLRSLPVVDESDAAIIRSLLSEVSLLRNAAVSAESEED